MGAVEGGGGGFRSGLARDEVFLNGMGKLPIIMLLEVLGSVEGCSEDDVLGLGVAGERLWAATESSNSCSSTSVSSSCWEEVLEEEIGFRGLVGVWAAAAVDAATAAAAAAAAAECAVVG